MQSILNLLMPPRCICGKKIVSENNSICSPCFNEYFIKSTNTCTKCDTGLEFDFGENALCSECIEAEPLFDKAKFIVEYNPLSARIISRIKYTDKTHSVKKISEMMANKIVSFAEDINIITSIPTSRKKLFLRKFNQSALLANNINKLTGILTDNQILLRKKNVAPQASLKRNERIKNMKEVFDINAKKLSLVKNKNILIIDDVITTRATINEASKILKKAGAAKVFALTFAKTPLK